MTDDQRWRTLLTLLSLDTVAPFLSDMGLQTDDPERLRALTRRALKESESDPSGALRRFREQGPQDVLDWIEAFPYDAEVDGRALRHWTIPVTVCGPRTIPFIEWHGARGSSDDTVIEEFNGLLSGQEWVVLYGHPCYEGVRDGLLRKVFHAVSKAGFRFVTHRQMAERLDGTADMSPPPMSNRVDG